VRALTLVLKRADRKIPASEAHQCNVAPPMGDQLGIFTAQTWVCAGQWLGVLGASVCLPAS
jgi:hypothetical protein